MWLHQIIYSNSALYKRNINVTHGNGKHHVTHGLKLVDEEEGVIAISSISSL